MPMPFYIVGPTASGKSGVGLALAERIGGEIVNADAFQLYRGLDIVTAKPSAADRARVPHHLYDVLDPTENCDAQRFREMALPVIAEISARGVVPIVVGGSGLYVKALTHGLAVLPKGDEAMREQFSHRTLKEKTTWLLQLDPQAGTNVNLRNPRYVERALEVCLITGRPQSELRRTFADVTLEARGVFLDWDRALLYERINARVRRMIAAGLVDEVRGLDGMAMSDRLVDEHTGPLTPALPQGEREYERADALGEKTTTQKSGGNSSGSLSLGERARVRGGAPDCASNIEQPILSTVLPKECPAPSRRVCLSGNAEKAIGIQEIRARLAGECTLDEATAAMQQATRRYAKRQVTWFRREKWLQTICLTPDTTADSAARMMLELFPDLDPKPVISNR